MKTLNKLLMASILAIGVAACGNSNGTNNNSAALVGGGNGLNGLASGGCQTISAAQPYITFAASGINTPTSYTPLLAGVIPNYDRNTGTYGNVALNAPNYTQGVIPFQEKTIISGFAAGAALDLSVTPSGTTSTVFGRLALNQNQIQSLIASGGSSICSVALDVVTDIESTNFNPYAYSSSVPTCTVAGQCTGFIQGALVFLTASNGQTFYVQF